MYKIWQINYRTGTRLLRTLPPLTHISLKSIDKGVSCIYFLELPDNNIIDVGVTSIGEVSNKIADAQKFFSNDVVCLGIQLCQGNIASTLWREILYCFERENKKHRDRGLLCDSPKVRSYIHEYCSNPQIAYEAQESRNTQNKVHEFRLLRRIFDGVEGEKIIDRATDEYKALQLIYKDARRIYRDAITLTDTAHERDRLCATAITLYEDVIPQTLKWVKSYEQIIRKLIPTVGYPLTEPAILYRKMLSGIRRSLTMYFPLLLYIGGNPWLMIRASSLLIPASQAIGIICQLLKDMAQAILSQTQASD